VTSLADPNTAGGVKTTITCTGATFFDANKMIAIFSDNVEVRHPQFFISCDELEVHMVKEDGAKPGAAAKAKPPNPAPAAPPVEVATPENATGVKFAIARGRMVVIEKLTETGELQVGKCRHATFEGSTEDMLLRDFPQVQRGNTLQVATDPSTTMTIKKNGQFSASGPSRTDIVKDVPTKKKTTLGTPAAPVPSPNPSPQ
jgi:lipopolysaccharide export system protein LptA